MDQSTIWWVVAGGVVAAELATGTFYLIMVAAGMAAGAIAAHLGFGLPAQLVVAAVAGVGLVAAWAVTKNKFQMSTDAAGRHEMNLDVGESVTVEQWLPDGTARVNYRGAQWQVALRPGSIATPGLHRVYDTAGNRLLVEKI